MQIIGTKRIVDKDGCVDVLLYMQDNIYSIKYTVDDYSRHTVFNFSKEVSKTEAQRLYGALSIQMPFMQAFCKKKEGNVMGMAMQAMINMSIASTIVIAIIVFLIVS